MPANKKTSKGPASSPSRRPKKTAHRRTQGLRLHHAGALLLLVVGAAWGTIVLLAQPAGRGGTAGCIDPTILVNSCHPWVGAAVNNYPQVAGDTKSQMLYHEQRIGRQLDIVHTYHPVGTNTLSSTDKYFATRPNTYLFVNWKPAAKWADAAGGNAAVNASIDQMAASVQSLGSKRIFMTIHHEAENDVSNDTTPGNTCTAATYKGSFGTTDDYKAMWRNVRTQFNTVGATNVVWVMDYINYSRWDCLIDDLYPGDGLVDWVMFNAYGSGSETWTGNVDHFYNHLLNSSSGNHIYTNKPWGIVEWSYRNGTSAQHVSYFQQAKSALDNGRYPRLHAYMVYDSRDGGSSTGLNSRVAYDDNGTYQQAQVDAYNALVNDPKMTGASSTPTPPPTSDTTPPVVTITSPADGATVSGNITIAGTASDNVGVSAVTLRIDDQYVATDNTAPYSFPIDASKYKDGSHSVVLRAWDAANNLGEAHITVNVSSGRATSDPGTGGDTSSAPPQGTLTTTTITGTATSPASSTPLKVSGTVIVAPLTPGDSVRVIVDGKLQSDNTVDTLDLTNGTHTLEIIEGNVTRYQRISVSNSLPVALLNAVRYHLKAIIIGAGIIAGVGAIWYAVTSKGGFASFRERSITRRQRDTNRLGKM